MTSVAEDADKNDIQGDIWPGLLKDHEEFVLFKIVNVNEFKKKLKAMVANNGICTAKACEELKEGLASKPKQAGIRESISQTNIAFNIAGMTKLNEGTDRAKRGQTLRDDAFKKGMFGDMVDEGRDLEEDYDVHWRENKKAEGVEKKKFDGVLVICGTLDKVQVTRKEILRTTLGDSISHVATIQGDVFDKEGWRGHEHFGFLDGISQPLLDGLDKPKISTGAESRELLPPGTILVHNKGTPDERRQTRDPVWAKNGSYFVIRKLEQNVPKFHNYCEETAKSLHYTKDQLEARFVGRWRKGGAPVEKYPLAPPSPPINDLNNWDYESKDDQSRCPLASHIRRTNPRIGVDNDHTNMIIRRGIPYGPIWDPKNDLKNVDKKRGLLFTCYQSSIKAGFQFITNRWVSNGAFPGPQGGQDPVIGQDLKGSEQQNKKLNMGLNDGKGVFKDITFTSFIKCRGGDYFFMPPMRFLKNLET